MTVESRFKIRFSHANVFFLLAFFVGFYGSFVYYCIPSAFPIQRTYVFCAIARAGIIAIVVAQKVLVVTGDDRFDIRGAAIAYLNGVAVKDFAIFGMRGEVLGY